jgi:hypothetical protein
VQRFGRSKPGRIERKASEDIQMPMQAVDYWLRVRRHQQAGDFQRNGYFSGLEISVAACLAGGAEPPFSSRHRHVAEVPGIRNSIHARRPERELATWPEGRPPPVTQLARSTFPGRKKKSIQPKKKGSGLESTSTTSRGVS